MTKTIIGGALAGAALLAATACGGDARQMAEQHAASPTPYIANPAAPKSPGDPAAGAETASAVKRIKQVGKAALKAVPGSTLVSMETEENGSRWEVQVVDAKGVEHEMDIESGTAKVINGPSTENDDAEDKMDNLDRIKAAKLDYAQAADKIAKAVPKGHITELNLDSYRDKIVWEADVVTLDGTKQSMDVDAVNGKVTKDSETD